MDGLHAYALNSMPTNDSHSRRAAATAYAALVASQAEQDASLWQRSLTR